MNNKWRWGKIPSNVPGAYYRRTRELMSKFAGDLKGAKHQCIYFGNGKISMYHKDLHLSAVSIVLRKLNRLKLGRAE